MKLRLSLSWQIAMLAMLTLVTMTGLLLAFAGVQFRMSPESFIVAPAVNRVLSVAGELGAGSRGNSGGVARRTARAVSKQYGVDFYLVDGNAKSVTSVPALLPQEVMDDIAQRRPR
jgi:hypothetical protein